MQCGIIGLPATGKTALFQALTGDRSAMAHPGTPHIAIAAIPDARLGRIAGHITTSKVTPATIQFVDIPGLEIGKGAQKLGALLAHVREAAALCQVVGCFGADVDPQRDIRTVDEELILADLAVAEPARERAVRHARGDAEARARLEVLERVVPVLEEGRPVRAAEALTPAQEAIVRAFGFTSAKRMFYVANIDESELTAPGEAAMAVRRHAEAAGSDCVCLCASLEAELAELEGPDLQEMLEGLGLEEPAIGRVARAALHVLGLNVFYTAGPKEVRAWTVPAEATAPEAAGEIHTDMQRGFIRAECYTVDDLEELRSEKAIKAAGRLRVEGKSYRVRDGDVMHILFSV